MLPSAKKATTTKTYSFALDSWKAEEQKRSHGKVWKGQTTPCPKKIRQTGTLAIGWQKSFQFIQTVLLGRFSVNRQDSSEAVWEPNVYADP